MTTQLQSARRGRCWAHIATVRQRYVCGVAEDSRLLGSDGVSLRMSRRFEVTLKTKAIGSSETSGTAHPTTQHNMSEDMNLHACTLIASVAVDVSVGACAVLSAHQRASPTIQ